MSTRINLQGAAHGSSHEPDGADVSQTGLKDLIAGATPTFDSWTNNPTDAADITDGDISTFCTTGDKVSGGAYQYCHFEWDLGDTYSVMCTLVGQGLALAGDVYVKVNFWDGSAWVGPEIASSTGFSSPMAGIVVGARCSKVRLSMAADAATTTAPNIREFHVWRLA